jgi:hypothetical protein
VAAACRQARLCRESGGWAARPLQRPSRHLTARHSPWDACDWHRRASRLRWRRDEGARRGVGLVLVRRLWAGLGVTWVCAVRWRCWAGPVAGQGRSLGKAAAATAATAVSAVPMRVVCPLTPPPGRGAEAALGRAVVVDRLHDGAFELSHTRARTVKLLPAVSRFGSAAAPPGPACSCLVAWPSSPAPCGSSQSGAAAPSARYRVGASRARRHAARAP